MTTQMTDAEARLERECVEWVFGLTGGELDDKPVKYTYDTEYETGKHGTFLYTYDGVPEYAAGDYGDLHGVNAPDYFTAVACCLYGMPAEEISVDGHAFKRIATYQSSGETECCCVGCDEDPFAGKACPYCERAPGEEHGYIYLGDGWCEVVYRAVDADDDDSE